MSKRIEGRRHRGTKAEEKGKDPRSDDVFLKIE